MLYTIVSVVINCFYRIKRKSKWDQPAPNANEATVTVNTTVNNKVDENPPGPTTNEDGKVTAAKAAAAKLNAILAAKGKIIKSEPPPNLVRTY